jgi:hypothetical protein
VGAPKCTFRVSDHLKKFLTHVALMTSILVTKPSSCEEAIELRVWWDVTMADYNPILKEMVVKPSEELVIDSKCGAEESIEEYKNNFVTKEFY